MEMERLAVLSLLGAGLVFFFLMTFFLFTIRVQKGLQYMQLCRNNDAGEKKSVQLEYTSSATETTKQKTVAMQAAGSVSSPGK